MIEIALHDTRSARRERAQASRPRLGFAGVGWIGRNRLEAIARSGAGEIAAVFDPVAEAAQQAARIAGAPAIASRYEELLEADIDGVVIATPSALHASQAIAALARGKAVFCQKPLARTAAETRRIVAAAADADRLLHVDFSYRFARGMQQIRELIRRGALGRVYAIEAMFHNAYGPDKAWFYNAELAGGGCLLDLGVHLVDLALWCLDFPAVGNVAGQLLERRGSVEHYASVQFRAGSDTGVQLACSWKAPAGCAAQIGFTVFGSEGGATFRNVNGSFFDFVAEHLLPDRTRRVLAEPPDDWGGRAAVAWCEQLAESPRFDPACRQLVAVAETIDRSYGRPA